ncbi:MULTISPECIES: phage tail terminator protein [Pasteurellaceae]|uniref:Phage tail terminator protein n=1 Tax=Pasteurella atlantica TaxID=2827233 RepID=A0AAW8CPM5_9PAST|nr:phage tail terminator protein [Pasteurella atlantica]MBR0574203.1 phage tail protein [Pasteurella atlantica]MDP8039312.1 phage tail terminator protein [Pasteurella atlantica]MDP8041404.1 phage tail terminator protein [Pasteurella atlantica]MDP8043540.1 phage tail terminator protein [Pasteurella atlantica]MDP8045542.1 phage tail terminator protein [Pasteurella atlantica]
MKIHNEIRQEILKSLKGNIDVEEFHNGRPEFLDLDDTQSAVAVFIDEAERDDISTSWEEWRATLNIAVYLKTFEPSELDETIEAVVSQLESAKEELQTVEELDLSQINYESDTTQRSWHIANITYQITYHKEK